MKRTPLKRKTPLKSKTGLKSNSTLKSGGRLRHRSKKTEKLYREERIPFVQKILSERPICELCNKAESVDVHEIASRGRTGGVRSDEWLKEECVLGLCRKCHTFITNNPLWAEENGFLIPSSSKENVVIFLQSAKALREEYHRAEKNSPIKGGGPHS